MAGLSFAPLAAPWIALLIPLAASGDWDLEPVVPARPVTVVLQESDPVLEGSGPYRLLRYQALWDLSLHVECSTADDLGLFLEALDENGGVLGRGDGEATETCSLDLELRAGQSVRLRVGSCFEEEFGAIRVEVTETAPVPPVERDIPAAERAAIEADLTSRRELLGRARAHLRAGERASCRALLQEALAHLPEELSAAAAGHADLLWELGLLAEAAADWELAGQAWDSAHAVQEARLPGNDVNLANLRQNLGRVENKLSHTERAEELLAWSLVALERLPERAGLASIVRVNLADVLRRRGKFASARLLLERVLGQLGGVSPSDRILAATVQLSLANVLTELQEYRPARELLEQGLAVLCELQPDSRLIPVARMNLGSLAMTYRDAEGALIYFDQVFEHYAATVPADHPEFQNLRLNMASALSQNGYLEEAARLARDVLALSPNASHRQAARIRLATIRSRMEDFEGAAREFEGLLAEDQEMDAMGVGRRRSATYSLACCYLGLAEWEAAEAALREVIGEFSASPVPPDLQVGVRRHFCRVLEATGQLEELEANLHLLEQEIRTWLLDLPGFSKREMQAALTHIDRGISSLVDMAPGCRPESMLERKAFELVETARALSTSWIRAVADLEEDTTFQNTRARVLECRERVADLVASGAEPGRVVLATGDRDRAERALREAIEHAGPWDVGVQAEKLAAGLAPDEVAVGYREYLHHLGGRDYRYVLVAHLLGANGQLTRVELGSQAAIRAAVTEWRSKLDLASGQRLRELLLDPVLARCGPAKVLRVCADRPVHLIPLDALPLGDGVVGDQYAVHNRNSFSGSPVASRGSLAPRMLLVGGIDFGAPPRSAASFFAPLPRTEVECEAIGAIFRAAFETEPELRSGDQARKDTLRRMAPRLRFLHLATHGYFGEPDAEREESFQSEVSLPDPLGQTALRLAPMALCGLALAGANEGSDTSGRVPGILTAEELACMPLQNCELIVLSACDSNLGVQLAGQGMESLQAALASAGARTRITSLWKVDDRATQELFTRFYELLWVESLGPADALWQAKRHLREHPEHPEWAHPIFWAAWILSGEPCRR